MKIIDRINNLVCKVNDLCAFDKFGGLCESGTKDGIIYGVVKEDFGDIKKGETMTPEEEHKVGFMTYDSCEVEIENNLQKATIVATLHMYVNPNDTGNSIATYEFGLAVYNHLLPKKGNLRTDDTQWKFKYKGERVLNKFEYMVITCTATVYLPCDYCFEEGEKIC